MLPSRLPLAAVPVTLLNNSDVSTSASGCQSVKSSQLSAISRQQLAVSIQLLDKYREHPLYLDNIAGKTLII
jgi:hypothetical protein